MCVGFSASTLIGEAECTARKSAEWIIGADRVHRREPDGTRDEAITHIVRAKASTSSPTKRVANVMKYDQKLRVYNNCVSQFSSK
jgi:hypothetical protein